MPYSNLIKRLISIKLVLLLIWTNTFPIIGLATANAVSLQPHQTQLSYPVVQSANNWYEMDRYLADAVRAAHDTTEEYAAAELNRWVAELMKKVDNQFLNWYFDFFHQKATEDGVPFAWLAFKADIFQLLRGEDEKNLDADQVIQKRMLEEFNSKFKQLVLDREAEENLKIGIEQIAKNYASAIAVQFGQIKAIYHVPDQDWEKHLDKISQVIYDTGTSQSSLARESLISLFAQQIFMATTVVIATKLSAKFGGKAISKLAVDATSKLALEGGISAIGGVGLKLIDPLLAVGFLAWNIWDYQHMVSNSRPELRQNISDYLNELKASIFNDPDNSIMAAIEEVEHKLLANLES